MAKQTFSRVFAQVVCSVQAVYKISVPRLGTSALASLHWYAVPSGCCSSERQDVLSSAVFPARVKVCMAAQYVYQDRQPNAEKTGVGFSVRACTSLLAAQSAASSDHCTAVLVRRSGHLCTRRAPVSLHQTRVAPALCGGPPATHLLLLGGATSPHQLY